MFATLPLLALYAAAVALVSAHPAPTAVQRGYMDGSDDELESYATYHTRYMALGCENNDGDAFFDTCCHPRLLCDTSPFPAQCVPTTPSEECTEGDDGCECEDELESQSPARRGQLNLGGVATYFLQEGIAGTCGAVNSDEDMIVAIDQNRYGDASSLCGERVRITNIANGKSVDATIVDDCSPSCTNYNSIDLSLGAFKAIGEDAIGELDISWLFI